MQEEKRIEEEQAANARYWKIPACCDDDDDYNSAITPNEPVDSLSMGDEHLNTILATESDEFIKSYVENLVPNLSESGGENSCDVPACFITFSNILFDVDYEFDSVDDHSLSDEYFPEEIFSNPLFDEEIIPMKIDQHHFNVESGLIESLLNRDSSIISSSLKIDSLIDEFTSELTFLKSILPGIDETDRDPEEDIYLIERLFDSFMEEIDLTFTPDDPMPPSIEEDDYDSERDILIREELLDNFSLSLPVIESYHFDIPSFSRPPAKPPNGNTRILNVKMMGDISDQKLPVCYDDDDDEESSNSLNDNIISELPPYSAVIPTEPIDSLSMGDEYLDTIPATKSDEFIKSCVENLVPNLSESEGENKCDVPAGFTTFSNVLFDGDYDFDSSNDQSLSDDDVLEKIYSNPLFDEEIIPMEIDQHSFNAESDLIESIPNHDSSIIVSSKIDSLFDEFTGELTLLKSIPSGIDETDCPPEKEIRFAKRLFDSHMEEIDLSFNPDDPMPPGIEDDDYDSGRDIPILKELLDNYSLSLPANESYHFDIPSPYRPPAKPPD
nr:hypothetical protein [Tanacetum cinerariifolium]